MKTTSNRFVGNTDDLIYVGKTDKVEVVREDERRQKMTEQAKTKKRVYRCKDCDWTGDSMAAQYAHKKATGHGKSMSKKPTPNGTRVGPLVRVDGGWKFCPHCGSELK